MGSSAEHPVKAATENKTQKAIPDPVAFDPVAFLLTNQDGSVDANVRPVVTLSDADRYWDTDGKTGDAWNDDDETPDGRPGDGGICHSGVASGWC